MSVLTLILADAHHVVRTGLRLLLETRLACRVVGEATTGIEALALARAYRPDILIVDLNLPRLDGLEVTRAIRCQVPGTRVIVFALDGDDRSVQEALRAGAMAYVLKETLVGDFLRVIARVSAGQRCLSPSLEERVMSSFAREGLPAPVTPAERLSLREREVLSLVGQGFTSAEIARDLGIGVRTVEWHRARMLHKLGLHSAADLVRYALQHDLVPAVG